MQQENVSNQQTENLIKEVAELLGVDYETVKWDLSQLSIIEKLVTLIRKSGIVERVEGVQNGSAEKEE